MQVFLYVVVYDLGFAPNPFGGVCTLATCKPRIRAAAQVSDYIVGFGSKQWKQGGRAVYTMRVDEALTFDQYWSDARFRGKRPVRNGSLAMIFGDNIYHRSLRGRWIQADSHHSRPNGQANPANVKRDTSADRVLIGRRFSYWGAQPMALPYWLSRLRPHRGHRFMPPRLHQAFLEWEGSHGGRGYVSDPASFPSRGGRRIPLIVRAK